MRIVMKAPHQTYTQTDRYGCCVVEATDQDIANALRMYAHQRGQRIPLGVAKMKAGQTPGVWLLSVDIEPEDVEYD